MPEFSESWPREVLRAARRDCQLPRKIRIGDAGGELRYFNNAEMHLAKYRH